MNLFKSPFISKPLKLERLPHSNKGDLRASDAADELLLQTVFDNDLCSCKTPILVINDSFGALTIGLNEKHIHCWSDSTLTKLAIEKNLQSNKFQSSNFSFIPSTHNLSTKGIENQYDLVLIKIPKTLALLEDQLCKLKPHIHAHTRIIASAMSKHIHSSTLKLFEKIIGPTKTSRATKKARLVFADNDTSLIASSPYPKSIESKQFDLILSNHANVFSNDHLDIGSRFLLEQLPKCPQSNHIVDLGCGNGALGIIAKRLQPQAQVSFIDESYMAIASTKENIKRNLTVENAMETKCYVSNSLNQFELDPDQNKPDLILCNPPFHQGHSMGDQIAWEMFKQSYDVLNKDGELWIIGNRHLAYHLKMKKVFGNCKTVASNKKFVVLTSTRKK